MDVVRIGRFITELRQAKGLSQKELAVRLRVSDKTISKWETGKGLPDPSSWMALGEALDVGVNELLIGRKSEDECGSIETNHTVVETTIYYKQMLKRKYRWLMVGFIAIAIFISGALSGVLTYRLAKAELDTSQISYAGRTYHQSTRPFGDNPNDEILLESYMDTGVKVKGMEVFDAGEHQYASTILLLRTVDGIYLLYVLDGGP
jgi:transcriptional regulator with XRE-family HTH domain